MYSNEKLIYFLQQNLISADQAAAQLEVAKSTLMRMVKEGVIPAVYQKPKACLFLQQTITEYIHRKEKLNPGFITPRFHFERSTLYSEEKQKIAEAIAQMGQIRTIQVYFNNNDAVLDGYYYTDPDYRFGALELPLSPRMVMIDEYGDHIWIHSATAGYAGTGPHNAEEIVRLLPTTGLNQVPMIPEEYVERLFQDRIVKYELDADSGTWQCFSKDSYMDPRGIDSSDVYERSLIGSVYLFEGNFVMMQADRYSWRDPEMAKKSLERFKEFIPSPVRYVYYPTRELAMRDNRFAPDDMERLTSQAFQLIIYDKSGRQLWLAPYVETGKDISHQSSVLELLEMAGFNTEPFQKSSSVFVEWMTSLLAAKREEEPITGYK